MALRCADTDVDAGCDAVYSMLVAVDEWCSGRAGKYAVSGGEEGMTCIR